MKYGRKPRGHDPRFPKASVVRAGALPAYPASLNYAAGMPANLGFMLNDSLGDCVEAYCGHAIQVWSFNALGAMTTPPDSAIEQFYELAGGYVPGNPSTDNGTIIQVALTDWLTNAIAGNELAGFVEINELTIPNVCAMIFESGGVCVGFNVPAYFQNLEAPGAVWDVDPSADNTIIGGHCVDLVGYDVAGNLAVESWGSIYTMTPAFFAQFVDEAYGLANPDWIKKTGMTPAGLTLPQLQTLMEQFNVSTTLVPGVATLAVTSAPLPAGNVSQASNSVVVTDAAGTAYPAVVLTGAESTPWSWSASYAAGSATAVVTALDTAGATIGTPLSATFNVVAVVAATFEQPSGVSFVAASSSAKAAAQHAALKR